MDEDSILALGKSCLIIQSQKNCEYKQRVCMITKFQIRTCTVYETEFFNSVQAKLNKIQKYRIFKTKYDDMTNMSIP